MKESSRTAAMQQAHTQSAQMRAAEWRGAPGGMSPKNQQKRKKKEIIEYLYIWIWQEIFSFLAEFKNKIVINM